VTSKSPNQPADKAELQVADVILAVGGKRVTNMEDFSRLYDQSVKNKDATIPLQVRQDRSLKTVLLEVDPSAPPPE